MTDIFYYPSLSFKTIDEEEERAGGGMSWGRRMRDPSVLMFQSCHRRGCPFPFPGDLRSHQSFSKYASDIFHQPSVLMYLIFIINTHTEFSTWQKLVRVLDIVISSLSLMHR